MITPTDHIATVYLAYSVIAIGLIVWLAWTLYRSGALFLYDVFPGNRPLAEAVNRLLDTGFVMFNLGFAFFLLKGGDAYDTTEAIEVLARKLGILLIFLAGLHLTNMFILNRIRGHSSPKPAPTTPAGTRHVPATPATRTTTAANASEEEWARYEQRLAEYEARVAQYAAANPAPRTQPPFLDGNPW